VLRWLLFCNICSWLVLIEDLGVFAAFLHDALCSEIVRRSSLHVGFSTTVTIPWVYSPHSPQAEYWAVMLARYEQFKYNVFILFGKERSNEGT